MIRDKLPLGKKITITIPDAVSPEGQAQITSLLRDYARERGIGFDQTDFPDDWDWSWVVSRGTFAGTIPTRISKLLHRDFNVNLAPKEVAKIGNVARANSGGYPYVIDFTDRFDWDSGDFGDSGSCFWGCNAGAKDLMMDNGFLAMRVYTNGRGFGRCWMLPDFPVNGALTMFNCYPKNFKLITTARILATQLGYSYKRIGLQNCGSDCNTLYINGDGGMGYVVAPQEIILNLEDRYDFQISDEGYDDSGYTCEDCGDRVDEDDIVSSENGDHYCRHCYNERYFHCEHCGGEECNEDGNTVHIEGVHHSYEENWCEHCVEYKAVQCWECEDLWNNSDVHEFNGCYYCPTCYDNLPECHECGDKCDNLDDDGLCPVCQPMEEEEDEPFEIAYPLSG